MLIEQLDDSYSRDEPDSEKPKSVEESVNSNRRAVKLVVGAGARILFYPTLIYNVVRNKLEADFRWWDQIEQFLFLGAVPFPKDVFRLKDLGVEAVITLNESYETLVSSSLYESQMIKHLVIPTRDYLFAPSFDDIERAVDFIHENVEEQKATYVHCKAGRGRSTTIVLCYLVKYRKMTPSDAFHYVRAKRPRVMLAASQWKAVMRYYQLVHKNNSANISSAENWPIYESLKEPGDYVLSHHCKNSSEEPFLEIDHLLTQSDMGFCGESPVLVDLSDLEGYEEGDADVKCNDCQSDLGLAHKVGAITARSVIGIAKASVTLTRLSYVWLGYQAGTPSLNMTLTCSAITDADNQSSGAHQPMVSLHVCHQGLVKC